MEYTQKFQKYKLLMKKVDNHPCSRCRTAVIDEP